MRRKAKQILKIITDLFMTALLLLLMAYSLIGEAAHEWLGIAIFGLFILHHVLNLKWCRNLFRGKYPPIRILQTALALSVLRQYAKNAPVTRFLYSFVWQAP